MSDTAYVHLVDGTFKPSRRFHGSPHIRTRR
jgi:hypothetical protein